MSWAKTASAASSIAKRVAARAGRALRLAAFRSPAIATANHRSPTWAAPVRRISGAAAASVNWRNGQEGREPAVGEFQFLAERGEGRL